MRVNTKWVRGSCVPPTLRWWVAVPLPPPPHLLQTFKYNTLETLYLSTAMFILLSGACECAAGVV